MINGRIIIHDFLAESHLIIRPLFFITLRAEVKAARPQSSSDDEDEVIVPKAMFRNKQRRKSSNEEQLRRERQQRQIIWQGVESHPIIHRVQFLILLSQLLSLLVVKQSTTKKV